MSETALKTIYTFNPTTLTYTFNPTTLTTRYNYYLNVADVKTEDKRGQVNT